MFKCVKCNNENNFSYCTEKIIIRERKIQKDGLFKEGDIILEDFNDVAFQNYLECKECGAEYVFDLDYIKNINEIMYISKTKNNGFGKIYCLSSKEKEYILDGDEIIEILQNEARKEVE